LRARIADVTETHGHTMESPKVLQYLVGEEFRPHFDIDIILNPGAPHYAKRVAEGGQRAVTFRLSLNDDYECGESEFPSLGRRWKVVGTAHSSSATWSTTAGPTAEYVTQGFQWHAVPAASHSNVPAR
jgi:hypothetical protein